MEYHIENLKDKAFITDDARWIWKWIEGTYADSIQIVGSFHAKEHLWGFAKNYFKNLKERSHWIDKQSETILMEGITPVVETMEKAT